MKPMSDPVLEKYYQDLLTKPNGEYFVDMFKTVERMLREVDDVGDIRLVNMAMKELRYGLKVFSKYQDIPKVSIFGSARTAPTAPEYHSAKEFGRLMAEKNYMIITGAGGGIMQAGMEGAGREKSIGLNIHLPFEQQSNPVIHDDAKLITFKYFFTRKLFFLKASNAVAYFPGGFGTQDEAFEALTLLQTGKQSPLPILLIDHPGGEYWKSWDHFIRKQFSEKGYISPHDHNLYFLTDDIQKAVQYIDRFYAVYHSSRFVKDLFCIRLKTALTPAKIDHLNREFYDILTDGMFYQSPALPEENNEYPELQRLCGKINRTAVGRLMQLILALGA